MNTWKAYLRADPLPWLLEPDNPSVRYLTMTELLDKPERDPDVVQAKQAIMTSDVMQSLLQGQTSEGYWGKPERFYLAKYHGATWRFILFAELGAEGNDPRIRSTAEFLLAHSQDLEGGGFCSRYDVQTDETYFGTPCLTGNMVWSLIRLGYLDDLRTQKAIAWMLRYGRYDDGEIVGEKPYWVGRHKVDCWGYHTCMNGVIAILQALAEIPPEKRTPEVAHTLAVGTEYVLIHHVYKRSHDLDKPIAAHYRQLGFPLFYQNDMLRMLLFLTRLGVRDARMQDAVDDLVKKQSAAGRWKLQKTFNDQMPVSIEEKGQPSKWITLRALTALKRYYSR